MNIEPEDDLDITAELPQLDWQDAEDAALDLGGDTAHLSWAQSAQVGATLATSAKTEIRKSKEPVDPTTATSWPTIDELLSVRDKIVELEATVLDAELKLAKLDKQHQELQAHHAELRAHDAEMSRDRERLDAERGLLVESRQQLSAQLERFQVEAAAQTQSLQQQLEQQRQQTEAVRVEQVAQQEYAQAELLRHQDSIQQLTATLHDTQAQVTLLTADLQAGTLACAQQETAAATLARNLSHELLEKQALQTAVELRDLRIGTLEQTQQDLGGRLSASQDSHQEALAQVDQLQTNLADKARQIVELQAAATTNEQRAARISEQLETEHGRVRASEQDQERLTRLAAVEHASYESARQELAGRLLEVKALQEQLAQTRAVLATQETQLAERDALLHSRDELLAAKQQTLQLATDSQAAAAIRESALTKSLAVLEDNFRQTQTVLQERNQALQSTEGQLTAERLAAQQVQEQLAALRTQLLQAQTQQDERDQFILDQAAELRELRQMTDELGTHLAREQAAHAAQRERVLALEAAQEPLRAERDQHALLLAQTQQELDAKQLAQGANAKQVEALQQELRQHVDALNAIRRDIHQVAQQSRYRESELLVRTLIRVDDESVVHLLNKPVMVVGRASDAEICIRADSISRRHACLRVGRDVVIVEDLGSTNGCYVNGKRVKRQLLKDGDKLEIGEVQFRFATRATQNG